MSRSFYHGSAAPNDVTASHYLGFSNALRHVKLGRAPLDERSA